MLSGLYLITPVISEKDERAQAFAEFETPFTKDKT